MPMRQEEESRCMIGFTGNEDFWPSDEVTQEKIAELYPSAGAAMGIAFRFFLIPLFTVCGLVWAVWFR